jgi:NAD kinase
MPPRVVVVTRATEYEQLLARHATRGQAAFFLATRGQRIEDVEEAHDRMEDARGQVRAAIPARWRRSIVDRGELHRFLFEPDDIVAVVGQDGLVANVAKYLDGGQPLIGFNPDPERIEGVLVGHAPGAAADLYADVRSSRAAVDELTMAECRLDDGRRLVALNEIFVGHVSHQSARYDLRVDGAAEYQSSSGLIVATGTGQTGWSRSIRLERRSGLYLPAPAEPLLTLFVREAWPSVQSGAELTEALIGEAPAEVASRMDAGGVVFGDGIEADRLELPWGARATIGPAAQRLRLVRSLESRRERAPARVVRGERAAAAVA